MTPLQTQELLVNTCTKKEILQECDRAISYNTPDLPDQRNILAIASWF